MNVASKHLRTEAAEFREAAVENDNRAERHEQNAAEARADAAKYRAIAAEYERAADILASQPAIDPASEQEKATGLVPLVDPGFAARQAKAAPAQPEAA